MNEFPAHIKSEYYEGGTRDIVQSVQSHCRQTAAYAGEALAQAGMYHAGYLAGLVHDSGKFTQIFSKYLWKAYNGEAVQRGSVNHTFTGCRMCLEHFHCDRSVDYRDVTAELLAYAVGAHHGQFDCIDEKGDSGFLHRMKKEDIAYEEAKSNFLKLCAGWSELEQLFEKAHEELLPIYEKISQTGEQQMFCLGQLARLLLSAVIEGDRRDTAEFMEAGPPREPVRPGQAFWKSHLNGMERKLGEFRQDTQIKATRSMISDLCRQAAEKPGGIYRLYVPTGGGKTLSSLRYALAHAAKWEKQHIIFVTPLLTILEQNAAVIREYLGDDSIILEHHSNVLRTDDGKDGLDLQELAVDSWDAPVILTTLVQFLNTLFSGKTTSIRRYQALCNAVVVIDEVQTVPNRMLSLFNTAVNFLGQVCGTTFLLCSATQPCFDEAQHPLRLNAESELIPYREEIWSPFQRTVIKDAGALRLEQIPAFIQTILMHTDSLLLICNKKSESEYLYQHMVSEQTDCYHLSSSMCMAHRRNVLQKIQASLKRSGEGERKTVCFSTQVMEAGVDISFGCVIRLAAGMDSIVQSAGRCNRNAEKQSPAPVYILQCTDENLSRLQEIKASKQATIALLNQFRHEPERFGRDLSSREAIEWYYRKLYQEENEGYQQYSVKTPKTNRKTTLFQMLSWNGDLVDSESPDFGNYTMMQAFQTAGTLFRVMDDDTEDVVVPYGEGETLIQELERIPKQSAPCVLRSWIQRAKPYTISVYQYEKEKLSHGLRDVRGVMVLKPEYYDADTGLIFNPELSFLEA